MRFNNFHLMPRPIQKAHPPIWIPGFGSRETVDLCAHPDRMYAYLAVFMPDHLIKMFFDYYRERADHYGYTASPHQMRHLVSVYVAETDEQAEAETAQHVLWHYHKGLRHKWEQFFPPGYATPQAMRRIIENAGELDFPSFSFKQLNEKGYCIVGSVNTVRERIAQYSRDLGFGLFLALTHFGGLPNARCRGSMEPLASEVMPSLRAEFAHMV